MRFMKGQHAAPTRLPVWALPTLAAVSAVAAGMGVFLLVRWSLTASLPVGGPTSSAVSEITTTAQDTTTTTTAEETVTTTATTIATTTTARRTTTTTTQRTTIPSVKPPTVQVEGAGVKDPQKTTAATTRATGKHEGYEPVRPDRVSLPDLPHLYGSTGHLVGMDVSNHNPRIDWEQVKAAGIRFAIIRCGYRTTEGGKVYEDASFRRHIEGALQAGIPVGVYFYSAAVNVTEALEEAAFVLEVIKDYDVTWPIGYDFEEFRHDRNQNTTPQQATDNAIAFMDYVAQYGYTPMVYSSRNMLRDDFETGRLGDYRVWMAQYAELPYKKYEGAHAIWQCCSDGLVPGIDTHVDLNIAYEDLSRPHEIYLTPTVADTFEGFTFTDTWDEVEMVEAYRLRTTPHTLRPNIVTTGSKGLTLVRTGVDDDKGWSRVLYEGRTLYVANEGIVYKGTAAPTTTATTATTAAETTDTTDAETTQTDADGTGDEG